ncbi:putative flavin-containing monoamine oxidase C [Tolypocladium ophioglossoides CBS 100239]|uniref:Amine oxidase n=1 Tax=Tolypocladium ophioglossoides (strain CBS 100239) TaxID=1163406 RepID=A0A0L0NAV4_TOLOC|nr:putative flavin-containing monoamine oxidase C [Tolypocladium ophioglossoides CBS 100239]
MAAVQDMASTYQARGLPSRHKRSAQVIVIGAGPSGLQAAYNLQRAGATCLVLDARDRIGGGPVAADDYFNATSHPRVAELAWGLGLAVEQQSDEGKDVVEGLGASRADGTPNLSEDHRRSFIRVRDNLEGLSQRVDVSRPAQQLPNYGAMTVHELAVSQGATPIVQKLANAWTSTLFGLDSKDVSALCFLLHCKCAGGLLQVLSEMRSSEQSVRLQGGVEKLCEELAARLQPGSVCLSQVVERIDQTPGNKVVVTTQSGDVFQCTKAILAGPAQCTAIEVAPELSEDKQCLLESAKPGFSKRIALVYDAPWWRERGLSGCAQGLDGSISVVKDTSRDIDGFYSLTCFVAGESGTELWQKMDDERQQSLLNHVEAIYGDTVPTPCEIVDLDQHADTFSPAPACLAVPAANLRNLERDQWQPEGSVFFAGAEVSYVLRGHVEGELASGRRVAEEVIYALRPMPEAMSSRL